ncbi:MAG: DNA polymerase III subunit delta [Erysipelotrichaceae bacterium]
MNYLLYGEEAYRINQTIKKIKGEFSDESEMNISVFDASIHSINVIIDDANTIPFFSDKKIVIVNNANYFSSTYEGKEDLTLLENYLLSPLTTTELVLVGSYPKLDARKKIVKCVNKNARVLVFNPLDEIAKNTWIVAEVKRRNIKIEKEALKIFINRVACDMQIIEHELDKFEAYDGKIDIQCVKSLVTKQLNENVFDLVNAVVKKDKSASMIIWRDLLVLNTEPIALIALLAAQFRFLLQVKLLHIEGYDKTEITSKMSAHPYRVQLALVTINGLNAREIQKILSDLAMLDQKLKSGALDKTLGFELFLLKM